MKNIPGFPSRKGIRIAEIELASSPRRNPRTVRVIAATLAVVGLALILTALASSCGGAAAQHVRAEEIEGPAGVRCFAIVQDGQAVGGNCL